MKKILLAFMGMVFFAHMVHAANEVFYKLIRKDIVNEQHLIYPNGQGGLYNGTWGWVNYSDVVSQYINNSYIETACKWGGWERTPSSSYPENSRYNRGIINCDLTRLEIDGDYAWEHGLNSVPTFFWQTDYQANRGESPCKDYIDTIYAENAVEKPWCSTWRGSYMNFRIQKPNQIAGSWWKNNIGGWTRHILSRQYLTGNENLDYSEIECDYYSDDPDVKGCSMRWWSTIMDPKAMVKAMKNEDPHCMKPDGETFFTGDDYKWEISYTPSKNHTAGEQIINVSKRNCPTTYYDGSHTTAFVEYYSWAQCTKMRNKMPNQTYPCVGFEASRRNMHAVVSFNRTPCRIYDGSRTQCGQWNNQWDWTSRVLRCKEAYNQWWGSKMDGECYAVYGLTFKDSYQTGWSYGNYTNDITTARTTTQSYYPEMTCKWDGKDANYNWPHNAYVDKNLICTCKDNTFLGEDACNASITDSDRQYCEYDSNNGYCGWRLKTCATDRYKTSGTCQYYRSKQNKILKYYCTDKNDGTCRWSLEEAKNTVSECKGSSDYIEKYDSGRACHRKKAQ